MSDHDLTDFEQRFEQRLRHHAAISVRLVDADAVAREAHAVRVARRWWMFTRPALTPAFVILLIGLLLALTLAVFVGGMLRRPPQKPPLGRNGLIAYQVMDLASRPYNHVHVVNPDGTEDREIAQGTSPAYTADGKSIAFFSGWGFSEPDLKLKVSLGDGSNARDIATFHQTGFAVAPDGSAFAVMASGPEPDFPIGQAIWLISVSDGTGRELVPAPGDPTIRYVSLTWAPDGKSIAYAVMQEVTNATNSGSYRIGIDIADVATGEVRRLTSRPGTDSAAIAWSPGSDRLAFTGLPDGSPLPSLDAGTGPPYAFYPAEDIFAVTADGTAERNVTKTNELESNPRWSPDGSAIAYNTYADPELRVAVVDVDGVNTMGAARIGPVANEIVWSPDGTTLLLSTTTDISSTSGSGHQQFQSTIQTVGAGLSQPPTTLLSLDFSIGSLSWQWLEP